MNEFIPLHWPHKFSFFFNYCLWSLLNICLTRNAHLFLFFLINNSPKLKKIICILLSQKMEVRYRFFLLFGKTGEPQNIFKKMCCFLSVYYRPSEIHFFYIFFCWSSMIILKYFLLNVYNINVVILSIEVSRLLLISSVLQNEI